MEIYYEKAEIIDKIKCIFKEKYEIDFYQEKDVANENLLGKKYKLQAIDLLCLYYFLEEIFSVKIDTKRIVNGEFCTFNNIVNTIEQSHEPQG